MSGDTGSDWSAVLDELEAVIDRQKAVLDAGEPVDADALAELLFTVPAALPALPPELADRTRRALVATTALTARARELSAGAPPPVRSPGARRVASTFDRRA